MFRSFEEIEAFVLRNRRARMRSEETRLNSSHS